MDNKTPYDTLEFDMSQEIKFWDHSQRAGNIITKLWYRARATYAGLLVAEDQAAIEYLEQA